MTTHTPGPWIAECVGVGGSHDNPVDVYEVHNMHARVAEYLSEADARLVAAAPDLLAACQQLVDACNNAPPVELLLRISSACDEAKAAIEAAQP